MLTGLFTISFVYLLDSEENKSAHASGTFLILSGEEIKEAGHSDIAMNKYGQGVVVWQEKQKDWGVLVQLINSKGEKIGDAFMANQRQKGHQQNPKVAMNDKGDFIVVWQAEDFDGNAQGIAGQLFKAGGQKVGNVFKVNTYVIGNQILPDVVMASDGRFMIAWVSEHQDQTPRSIYAQLFKANGEKIGKELKINQLSKMSQSMPAMAINAKNNIMMVWQADLGNTSALNDKLDIYGQMIGWDGTFKFKQEKRINDQIEHNQSHPDITTDSKGNFMVVWANERFSENFHLMKENIMGQMISSYGMNVGKNFSFHPSFGSHHRPSVSSGGNQTVVAWQNYERGGWQIYVQGLTYNQPSNPLILLNKNYQYPLDLEMLPQDEAELDKLLYQNDKKGEMAGHPQRWNMNPSLHVDHDGHSHVVWTFIDRKTNTSSIYYNRISQ